MHSAASQSVSRGHIPALDGIRGLAVLAVLVLHFTVITPGPGLAGVATELTGFGWAGVDLFFVLSGFLITGILVDAKGSDGFYRNFYVRRALRIFPLFYAYLLVVLVVWPALSDGQPDPLSAKLLTAGYLGNFLMAFGGWEALPGHTTHLWSLAIEEQFYLIWPFVVARLSRARLTQLCVVVIVGAFAFRIAAHQLWATGIPGYVLLPARADTLAAGALLALQVRKTGWETRLYPWMGRFVLAGLTLLLLMLLVDPQAGDGTFTPLHAHVQLLGFPSALFLSLAAVLWAVMPAPASGHRPLIDSGLMQRLGRLSYGAYLLHIPLRNTMVSRLFPGAILPPMLGSSVLTQVVVLVVGIVVTFAIAQVSWTVFESPILRLKRHFEYGLAAAGPGNG